MLHNNTSMMVIDFYFIVIVVKRERVTLNGICGRERRRESDQWGVRKSHGSGTWARLACDREWANGMRRWSRLIYYRHRIVRYFYTRRVFGQISNWNNRKCQQRRWFVSYISSVYALCYLLVCFICFFRLPLYFGTNIWISEGMFW